MASVKKNIRSQNIKPAKNVSADILIPRLVFIISVMALILFGLVMVFSASSAEALNNNESPYYYLFKQIIFCVVGVVAALILWRLVPFKVWRGNATWWAIFILFAAMIATLFMGTDILGARRWLYFGPISFQPSEFAKIALVLLVAKQYAEFKSQQISTRRFFATCVSVVLLMLLFIVAAQSDLGTTIICTVGVLAVLWIGGAPKTLLVALVIAVAVLGAGFVLFSSYRSSRFQYLDPYNDGHNGYGAGYQIIRSYYALAEGGLTGMGLGNSFEKFQYLPEAETDFIFAIIGEELGWIGATFVILLFMVFLVSGMYIALRSKTRFGASVSGALVVMIVIQALINIGCVVGFLPTTGKPLPFISSGGSSLMASLMMVGLILSASEDDSKPDVYEKRRSSFKAFSMPSWVGAAKKNTASTKLENTEPSKPLKQNVKRPRPSKTGYPKAPTPTFKKPVKSTKINEPKFISKNDKIRQRNSSNRKAGKSRQNSFADKRNKTRESVQSAYNTVKENKYRTGNKSQQFKVRRGRK